MFRRFLLIPLKCNVYNISYLFNVFEVNVRRKSLNKRLLRKQQCLFLLTFRPRKEKISNAVMLLKVLVSTGRKG